MKNTMKYIKKIMGAFTAILIIVIVIVPYIVIMIYLRKKGRTIEIHPEFKIKKINRVTEVDSNLLNDSIIHAEEILKKIRGI